MRSRVVPVVLSAWIASAGVDITHASSSQATSPSAAATPPYRETVDRYCVTCHNQRLKTAGLTLDALDLSKVPADAGVWEKVVRKLRARAMPPPGARRPDEPTYHSLLSWLESELDAAGAAHPNPGRPVLHRLNQ